MFVAKRMLSASARPTTIPTASSSILHRTSYRYLSSTKSNVIALPSNNTQTPLLAQEAAASNTTSGARELHTSAVSQGDTREEATVSEKRTERNTIRSNWAGHAAVEDALSHFRFANGP